MGNAKHVLSLMTCLSVSTESSCFQASDNVAMGELRHRVLIGSTFSEESATAWFSNFGYHDVAVSLSAVHAALLKATYPEASLHVYNHPLETTYSDQVRNISCMTNIYFIEFNKT